MQLPPPPSSGWQAPLRVSQYIVLRVKVIACRPRGDDQTAPARTWTSTA